jgi:uncharacterized protein YjbJ (UPF0337 family)
MNKDIFEGKWKELRGQAKEWWGELTDDDLEQVGGKAEQFIGLLQQKYGYTREQADQEFDRWLKEAKADKDEEKVAVEEERRQAKKEKGGKKKGKKKDKKKEKQKK